MRLSTKRTEKEKIRRSGQLRLQRNDVIDDYERCQLQSYLGTRLFTAIS